MKMTFIMHKILLVFNSKFIKNYQKLNNQQLTHKQAQQVLGHLQHPALLLLLEHLQVYII